MQNEEDLSEGGGEVSEVSERGGKRVSPERDVNLFSLRACGRGVYGDVAAQGLFPGSASVCLFVCLFVVLSALGLVGGRGASFGARTGPNDSGERDLQKVKEKYGLIL